MNYIVLDLEATCWLGHPPHDTQEIIEIGAVKVDSTGAILGTFSEFVRPVVNTQLSGFCTKLTSIKQKDVDGAETFPTVIDAFKKWVNVDQPFAICSWGSFDFRALKKDCKLHELDKYWLKKHINVKHDYQKLKRLKQATGLKKAVAIEEFEFTGIHHRAISDAENLAKIFIKYIDIWGNQSNT